MKQTLPTIQRIVFLALLLSSSAVLAGNPCTAPFVNLTIHDTCFTGTTVGSTPSGVTTFPCSAVNSGDVWYKFTVPSCNPLIIVRLFGGLTPGRLNFGTFYVFTGSCSNLNLHYCGVISSIDSVESDTLTGLLPNDTIFIRVKVSGSGGVFDICIDASCPTEVADVVTSAQQLDVWPNPAYGELKYRFSVPTEFTLRLFDITGRMLMDEMKKVNSAEGNIDLTRFSSGMYLLQAEADGMVYTRKIAKD